MKKNLSKILLISLLGVIAIPILVLGAIGGGNIGVPVLWKKAGSAIFPTNSSWELGSSGTRVAKGWFSDLDASLFTIGGAVTGDLTLADGGEINTTNNGNIVILPNGTGNTRIGDASTPGSADGQDDLYVSGKLEVDGNLYTDSNLVASGAITLLDNNAVTLGTGSDSLIEWDTIQTNDALMITTGASSEAIIMCQKLDRNFNFDHAVQTNPTLFMHSANQSTTEWASIAHDQTDGVLNVGTGNIKVESNLAADKRLLQKQGADVVSANDITLGDGNYIDVTGATELQRMLGTSWTAGSVVILQFDSNPQVTHNTAAGGGYFGFQLSGAGNFAATAGDTLTVVFDGAWWREVARTAI